MQPNRQSGFTLLEVMIAVLVLAIGLLGLTALQAQGLRGGSSANQRGQATLLAYDMMERLRSDFPNAVAGRYNRALGDALPAGVLFEQTEMVDWIQTVRLLLPAGDAAIVCDAAGTCTVTVQWDDSRGSGNLNDNDMNFQFTTQI